MALTPKYLNKSAPLNPSTVASTDAITGSLNEPGNPIFNFSQDFIDGLQSVSTLELAQSVPFVRLVTVDMDGNDIVDVSAAFFQKAIDMDNVNENRRFSNRPVMSFKEISISTSLASGYLYYNMVKLVIRVHSPEVLREGDGVLMHLMIPGVPLKLEYGWNSPNEFLNQKEKLLFQVVSYNMNIDTTGQVDIIIDGMAFNESFKNIIVGDTGQEINSKTITPEQIDSVFRNKKKAEKAIELLKKVQSSGSGINTEVIKNQAESLVPIENRIRKSEFAKKYRQLKKNLKYQPTNFGVKSKHKVQVITFHDLIKTLCHETFEGMSSLFSGATEFRVIYGNFNINAGKFKGQSIADFPIVKRKLLNLFKDEVEKGQFIPTVGRLFNLIQGQFLENKEYWMGFPGNKEKDVFDMPDIAINFTNHSITENGKSKLVVDLQIIDIHEGIPLTVDKIRKKETLTPAEFEKAILNGSDLPTVRLGHAGSFVKNISLAQMTDQNMKASLIARALENRISSVRSTKLPSDNLDASGVTPLTLPLKGTANVLGHIGWKPFRAFFLSAGIYTVSAVYKITKVTHKLNAEGFNTSIEFLHH